MNDKYDEVNGGFKTFEAGDSELNPILREKELELARSLGVLAARAERVYPADDNPYKNWSAKQLQSEVERLKQP